MRKGKVLAAAPWLLAAILCLGGCGSSEASSASATDTAAYDLAVEDEDWGEVDEAAAVDSASSEAGSEEVSEAVEAENDTANRKLIRTVSMDLETREFDTLKANLEQAITDAGGYIESSNLSVPQGSYAYRYYSLTVRVPSDRLDAFIETAGSLGTMTNRTEDVEDVTLTYVDMTAYKESLQTEYERVTELLEEADDLDQILALESKLSDLRYEINSYESQLRTYDNLIDYSTVNLYISEVEVEQDVSPTVSSRIKNGFLESVNRIRTGAVDLFVWIVSNLPEIILYGALLILVNLLLRRMGRRRRAARMANAAAGYEKPPEETAGADGGYQGTDGGGPAAG